MYAKKRASGCYLFLLSVIEIFIYVNGEYREPNDVLIIGPRIIQSPQPKVMVYSRLKNPQEMLTFSVKTNEVFVRDELTFCSKLEGINNLYECTINGTDPQQESDGKMSYILTASLPPPTTTSESEADEKEIKQSVSILTSNLKFITMIQTDKSKYKTGDNVRMRIFFIHRDGTAVNQTQIQNFHVKIRNNLGEVVDAFSQRGFEPKVYSHTFHLSDEALEGDYKVHLWTNVKTTTETDDNLNAENKIILVDKLDVKDAISQKFTVAKHVQTDIKLNVETKRIVRPSSNITLKISGEYNNGSNIIGKINVIANVIHNGTERRNYQTSASVGNGEAFKIVPIDTEKDLEIHNYIHDYDVDITVELIDDPSQKRVVKNFKVTISRSDHIKVVLDPQEDYLKPGENFKMNVYLEDIDGNFIESTHRQVYVGATFEFQLSYCDAIEPNLRNETYVKVGTQSIKNFHASFEVRVPYNTTSITFLASYQTYEGGKSHEFVRIRDEFIVVRTPNVPMSRDYVSIITKSRFEITEKIIKYKIRSRGFFGSVDSSYRIETFYAMFIGESGQMKLEKITRKLNRGMNEQFVMMIEDWMIPSVNIIVFTHSIWREFVFDAKKIKVENRPTNKLAIKFLPESRKTFEFEPGQPIKMKLSVSDKNDKSSSLHLLGVDDSERYFDNDNEIIWNKLQYVIDQHRVKNDLTPVTGKFNELYDELENFNAFIMTNAHLTEKECSLGWHERSFKDETIGVGSKRHDKISIKSDKIPETFFFEDISGTKLMDEEYTRNLTAPHSIGNFEVRGFIFHPVHGLGIAEKKKFTVIKRDPRRRYFKPRGD